MGGMPTFIARSTSFLLVLLLAAAPGAVASPEAPAPKPDVVSRDDWGATPADYPEAMRHTPRVVLLHHAGVIFAPGADPAAKMRGLLRFSREEKGWPDVPYHFVVAPDGRVFEGRDLSIRPDTNTNFDTAGYVNVELLGHFDEQRVGAVQLASAARVVAWLADQMEMPTEELQTHAGVAPGQTACPGADFLRYLEDGSFQAAVDAARAGEPVAIDILPALPDGPSVFADAEAP